MMPTEIPSAVASALANLMSLLHPGWDVPGCRAALHAGRNLAPVDELCIAGVRFAMRADLRKPVPELFAAPDGSHWRGLTEHARTLRPADHPRCPVPGHEHEVLSATGECRLCRAEMLPDENPATPVVMVTDEQRVINVAGLARAQAALAEARRS